MLKQHLVAAVVPALLGITLSLAAQNPVNQRGPQPPGTASISGIVAEMGTNAPISGATVEARRAGCNSSNTPAENAIATTNADGRFTSCICEFGDGGGIGAASNFWNRKQAHVANSASVLQLLTVTSSQMISCLEDNQ